MTNLGSHPVTALLVIDRLGFPDSSLDIEAELQQQFLLAPLPCLGIVINATSERSRPQRIGDDLGISV